MTTMSLKHITHPSCKVCYLTDSKNRNIMLSSQIIDEQHTMRVLLQAIVNANWAMTQSYTHTHAHTIHTHTYESL